MPTVKREEGFAIKVLTSPEHNPPHVHVYKAGGECRIKLGDGIRPAELWDVLPGMSERDARRAEELVNKYLADCLVIWRRYNGHL